MIDGHCSSCVHWKPFDPERDTFPLRITRNRLGLCVKIGNEKDRNDRAEDDFAYGDEPPLQPDGTLAMADDASGLQSLRTAATFGCVLWEKKP